MLAFVVAAAAAVEDQRHEPAAQAEAEKGAEGQVNKTGILPVIFSPLQGGERT